MVGYYVVFVVQVYVVGGVLWGYFVEVQCYVFVGFGVVDYYEIVIVDVVCIGQYYGQCEVYGYVGVDGIVVFFEDVYVDFGGQCLFGGYYVVLVVDWVDDVIGQVVFDDWG